MTILFYDFLNGVAKKILNKIGVKQRYVTHKNQFTSDIATKAVEKLLTEHNIEKSKIDFFNIMYSNS
ncbi:hypothetical protein QIU18_03710 [Capnocytophaga canimorsus]|nr:hypothetical protein [Capnocytophaga canimorsus]WGU71081.1 hypothetical protein QIU18_03710 [Capnocytophaga canimorsus]